MRMLEIWRLAPRPRKVCAIGEELFNKYLEERKRSLKNDLGTDWFGRFLAALFNYTAKGASEYPSLTDDSGTARSIYIKRSVSTLIFNTSYYADVGCLIGIGTGSAAPSKTDYALANEVARQTATGDYADGSDYVVVSATFTLTADTDIYEVGLFLRMTYTTSSPYVCDVLLDRTVLDSPVTFPADTPMLVAYKFAI